MKFECRASLLKKLNPSNASPVDISYIVVMMVADDLVATGTNAEVIETFKCQSCRYILHSGYDVC